MYIRAGSDSDDYIAKIVSVFLIGHVREYVRAQCDDCLLDQTVFMMSDCVVIHACL